MDSFMHSPISFPLIARLTVGLGNLHRQAGNFDITGRPMKGWVLVSSSALADRKSLAIWVR